jgi:hypothetical protein
MHAFWVVLISLGAIGAWALFVVILLFLSNN